MAARSTNLTPVTEHVAPPEFSESRLTIVDQDQRDLEANKEKVDSEKPSKELNVPHGGEGESALPEDKYTELLERMDKDWEHDVINPRNWTTGRKWKVALMV